MKTFRTARVAEVIREVASQTVLFELHDPRIQGVTVTRVEVSADLQHAKVFVSIMGTESEQRLCLHALKHASGYIQHKLGDRLQMRFTPSVTFVLDKGVKHSIEISRLIKEAQIGAPGESAAPANEDPTSADGTAEEESPD